MKVGMESECFLRYDRRLAGLEGYQNREALPVSLAHNHDDRQKTDSLPEDGTIPDGL